MSNENYRPRGGNQQQQQQRRRGNNNNQRGGNGRNRNQNRGPANGGQDQGGRRDRGPRPTAPVKLTLIQRILKFFGLYKEPKAVERKQGPSKLRIEGDEQVRAPRSNTRVVKSASPNQTPRNDNPETRERRKAPVKDADSSRLYVGNLSYDVSESDLVELFKGVGAVRSAEVVYNRHTHRSKGYAFVEMAHVDDASRAMEVLHDQHFMGRKLNISGAQSKPYEKDDDAVEIKLAEIPAAKPAVDAAAATNELTEKAIREEVTPLAETPAVKATEIAEAAPADEVKVS